MDYPMRRQVCCYISRAKRSMYGTPGIYWGFSRYLHVQGNKKWQFAEPSPNKDLVTRVTIFREKTWSYPTGQTIRQPEVLPSEKGI